MINFNTFKSFNNVIFLTEECKDYSNAYLNIRKKEQRLLSDADVLKLPNLNKFEWPQRVKSTNRFLRYIKNKKSSLTILDIGCGNGWFTNKIAETSERHTLIGLDINTTELLQAARLFTSENLTFVHADLFECHTIFKERFDIITLNGSIQYFDNFKNLISQLNGFLKTKGEIHIIDSPFYLPSEIPKAKERTLQYYTNLGYPEMAKSYYHHSNKFVSQFDVLYKRRLLNKIFKTIDSPFMWLRLKKEL